MTETQLANSTTGFKDKYVCKTTTTIQFMEVECGMADLKEFIKYMNIMAFICGFEDDGSSIDLREDNTMNIHAITKGNEGYPSGPTIWIIDLYNHHEFVIGLSNNCNRETKCFFYVRKHVDNFSLSSVYESHLSSITISYSCEMDHGGGVGM